MHPSTSQRKGKVFQKKSRRIFMWYLLEAPRQRRGSSHPKHSQRIWWSKQALHPPPPPLLKLSDLIKVASPWFASDFIKRVNSNHQESYWSGLAILTCNESCSAPELGYFDSSMAILDLFKVILDHGWSWQDWSFRACFWWKRWVGIWACWCNQPTWKHQLFLRFWL